VTTLVEVLEVSTKFIEEIKWGPGTHMDRLFPWSGGFRLFELGDAGQIDALEAGY